MHVCLCARASANMSACTIFRDLLVPQSITWLDFQFINLVIILYKAKGQTQVASPSCDLHTPEVEIVASTQGSHGNHSHSSREWPKEESPYKYIGGFGSVVTSLLSSD